MTHISLGATERRYGHSYQVRVEGPHLFLLVEYLNTWMDEHPGRDNQLTVNAFLNTIVRQWIEEHIGTPAVS